MKIMIWKYKSKKIVMTWLMPGIEPTDKEASLPLRTKFIFVARKRFENLEFSQAGTLAKKYQRLPSSSYQDSQFLEKIFRSLNSDGWFRYAWRLLV